MRDRPCERLLEPILLVFGGFGLQPPVCSIFSMCVGRYTSQTWMDAKLKIQKNPGCRGGAFVCTLPTLVYNSAPSSQSFFKASWLPNKKEGRRTAFPYLRRICHPFRRLNSGLMATELEMCRFPVLVPEGLMPSTAQGCCVRSTYLGLTQMIPTVQVESHLCGHQRWRSLAKMHC